MTLSPQQREFIYQCCVVEQIPSWFPGLLFTAFPGKGGDAKDGFMKKRMGVKPGWPDIQYTWNSGKLECGVTELKVTGGRVSPDQNRRISELDRMGWHTEVCWNTAESVFKALCSWGLDPKSKSIKEPDYRTWDEKTKDAFNYYTQGE